MWKKLLYDSILRSEPLDVQVRLAVPPWPRAARDVLQHPLRFTSTTGISRAPFVYTPRLPSRYAFWVVSPFQDPTSWASLAQGLEYGFRRFEHPPLRLLAPRLVTPTRVARTPSVASSWPKRLETPPLPGARNAHRLRAHQARPLARSPPPAIPLSRDLPAGPPPAILREEERDWRSPRCLPS